MSSPRVGIVAAEPSGDVLAAGLMAALREALPGVRFEGVAGPQMERVGIDTWAPMESLSIMGLFEVLRHLPRLLRLRKTLVARWRDSPPAIFIGVDAPDFNLTLEQRLRAQGIPTVHYVSPTVWAWRTGRVRKIRRAADRLLTIFPFEKPFLAGHGIKAAYVGHRLANEYPSKTDQPGARVRLGLSETAPVLAILPGSRRAEIERLTPPFLATAERLLHERNDLQIIVPLANEKGRALFDRLHTELSPDLPLQTRVCATREALAAADVALVASGTATLEGLLSQRPMVVGYRTSAATYWLVRMLQLVRVEHVAMANLLCDEALAPEFIQDDCTPDRLVPALRRFFDDPAARRRIGRRYAEVHSTLRMDTDRAAADAVLALMRERGVV